MKLLLTVNRTSVIVDDNRYELLVGLGPWYLYNNYAGLANGELMHNIILPHPDHLCVDHIDRNTLNNQYANLRLVTRSQNHFNRPAPKSNTSKYKGVAYHKKNNKWVAQIRLKGKLIYLGSFLTAELAALAYNKAAVEMVGACAFLNLIDTNWALDKQSKVGDI